MDHKAIALDHYLHWAAVIGVGLYTWQLHGIVWGLVAIGAIMAAIAITNIGLMALTGNLRIVRFNRWFWVLLALAIIAGKATEFGRAG